VNSKKDLQNLVKGYLLGIVIDLYNFGVTGNSIADIPVGRIRRMTTGITGDNPLDAPQLLIDRLQTPKTATAQSGGFTDGC